MACWRVFCGKARSAFAALRPRAKFGIASPDAGGGPRRIRRTSATGRDAALSTGIGYSCSGLGRSNGELSRGAMACMAAGDGAPRSARESRCKAIMIANWDGRGGRCAFAPGGTAKVAGPTLPRQSHGRTWAARPIINKKKTARRAQGGRQARPQHSAQVAMFAVHATGIEKRLS